MLSTILLQAAAGMGIAKMGATIGAGFAAIGAGIGIALFAIVVCFLALFQ